jgi:hypothetical protein
VEPQACPLSYVTPGGEEAAVLVVSVQGGSLILLHFNRGHTDSPLLGKQRLPRQCLEDGFSFQIQANPYLKAENDLDFYNTVESFTVASVK